jgi:hypothetical protein
MAAQPGRIVFGILGATLRLGGFGDGLELEGVLHHGPTAIHLLAPLGLLVGVGMDRKPPNHLEAWDAIHLGQLQQMDKSPFLMGKSTGNFQI